MFSFIGRFFAAKDKFIRINKPTFNAPGFPDTDLTWKKASKVYPIIPMTIIKPLLTCPICGKYTLHQQWDWWDIEEFGGQYMVQTWTCPDGHGHYGEWA